MRSTSRQADAKHPPTGGSGSSAEPVTHRPATATDAARASGAGPQLRALHSRRMIVADVDPQRAEMLARALAAHGASVIAVSSPDADLREAHALDPEVVLVDADDAAGCCLPILDALQGHPRTRWAVVLPFARSALWPSGALCPELTGVAGALAGLMLPAIELAVRAKGKLPHEVPLEVLGPARMLRVLCATRRAVRVELTAQDVHAQLELADGKVCSARVRHGSSDDESISAQALAVVLELTEGRVRIEERDAPGRSDWNVALETALLRASAPDAVHMASGPAASELAAPELVHQSPAPEPPPFAIEVETYEPTSFRPPAVVRSAEHTPLAVTTQITSTPAMQRRRGGLRTAVGAAVLGVLLMGAALLVWFTRSSLHAVDEVAKSAPSANRLRAAPRARHREPPPEMAAAAPRAAAAPPDDRAELPGSAADDPAPPADASNAAVAGDGVTEQRGRLGEARDLVSQAGRQRRSGRLDLAESSYLQALEIVPRYPRAIAGLVRVYLQRKDGAAAVRWAEQLVAVQPRASHELLLGDAHALNGDAAAAERAWKLSKRHGNATARERLRGR